MISNVCRANFNGGRTAQGNNRFQWDYGQILEISGIENLPDPFTAQFSNTPVFGTAKTAVGTGGRVEIPNEYFVSGQNIYCFIVLHTDEDDGRTVYIATIPVTKRPKPIDDPITPTQQSTIDTAIAALQAGVAKAEGFAGDAEEQAGIAQNAATTATEAAETATGAVADVEAAATRAETAAEGAEASATAAETSARSARQSAQTAQYAMNGAVSAAEAASDSAQDADAARQAAQAAERDAQAAKTAAEASATAAAGSASAASGSASQAAQKATEASSSATAASTSATNAEAAKTGAETAQTAAETAQASAEEAAANAEQSATTAEWYAERVERFLPTDTASGEIASFPDGADSVPMQSVVVTMEPVQDLHGYDNPWPAGGGKNKLDSEPIKSGYIRGSDGVAINGVEAWRYCADYSPIEPNKSYVLHKYQTESSSVAGYALYDENKQYISGTNYSGSTTVTISTPANARYIRASWGANSATPVALMLATETDTAFAPYSNICPITGYDSGTVWETGGNVWNEEWTAGTINANNGQNYDVSPTTIRSVSFCPCKGGATYYSTMRETASIYVRLYWYAEDGTYINYSNLSAGARYSATAPDNATQFKVSITGTYGTTYLHDFSITTNPTQTGYQPYVSASYHSDFPSTVYGGAWDVVSGDLVVDRAMYTFTGGETWTRYATTDNWYISNPFAALYAYNVFVISDKFIGKISGSGTDKNKDGSIWLQSTSSFPRLYVCNSNAESASDMQVYTVGASVVYPLATPITYHLTPQEVRTLLGTNNVWSDAGETAVTYKADVQLYIDKRIFEALS